MILWAGGPVPNTNPHGLAVGITHHRRAIVLRVRLKRTAFVALSFGWQYRRDGEWRGLLKYRSVSVATEWRWGERHDYYDGCHCEVLLGFLRIAWQPENCRKCEGDQ